VKSTTHSRERGPDLAVSGMARSFFSFSFVDGLNYLTLFNGFKQSTSD